MTYPGRGADRPVYSLAAVKEGTKGAKIDFRIDVELSQAEYDELREALNPIMRLGLREMFKIVARNYEQVESLNTYATLWTTSRDGPHSAP